MKRGDVYQANLDPVIGSEQGGIRPVVIIQNDRGNRYSPTVIVVAVTTRRKKPQLPVHVLLTREESGLKEDSIEYFIGKHVLLLFILDCQKSSCMACTDHIVNDHLLNSVIQF